MESNYNSENFERLLRESSDQYRMYPSESVWKNVYNALHTRRRWFSIGLILLLSAGFVTTIMMTSPAPVSDRIAGKNAPDATTVKATPGKASEEILIAHSTENFTDNNKIALFQSEPLADNSRTEKVPEALPAISRNQPETVLTEITNAEMIPAPGMISETGAVPVPDKLYTPISVVMTDPATDQDAWFVRNGMFLNNDLAHKKNQYRMQTAFRPLTIESVINSYARRNKKLSFQFYFTPTISYRKLSENKSYPGSASTPNRAIYKNINNAVTHKPDMGIEVGAAARYAVGKNLKIRAGLQFNTSRYDIKAFSYAAEITTIALNTGSYTLDSVNTISSYRNFNGYKSDWLHNFYFQISAPVGIELKLAGDDKIQFGIGSTIQPTYVLGDRAYLLSSNYKNYAEVPWLMRRWNMNASFEAFVSYSTGKMNWQVGPQIRYQLQSSFVKEYPVKENLFDFGLKIGVSANK